MTTTLREAVEQAHVRTGRSDGTSERGAYWLACNKITLRHYGSGTGQGEPEIAYKLELRHYRGGEVQGVVRKTTFHEDVDRVAQTLWCRDIDLCDCGTVEDVVIKLQGGVYGEDRREECYSDYHYKKLRDALELLGLAESAPAPDDTDDDTDDETE